MGAVSTGREFAALYAGQPSARRATLACDHIRDRLRSAHGSGLPNTCGCRRTHGLLPPDGAHLSYESARSSAKPTLLKNIAMAGGFMLLTYVGAGRISIDGRLATPSLRVISGRPFHPS
jgi:hypothetical protein